jgi:hypothetical protein
MTASGAERGGRRSAYARLPRALCDDSRIASRRRRSVPREFLAVWLLFAVPASAILVTYARLPADELYNVSGTGLEGGASRVLVFLDFPTALAALPVVVFAWGGLHGRAWRGVALAAIVLCAAVLWPGIVNQANLDARWINSTCAVGVVLAVIVSLAGRRARWARSSRGDRIRVGIGVVLAVLSPPWIAAELGFFLNRVPLLGRIYLSGQYRREQPGLPSFAPAVHHGDHHGLNGVLLVLTALLLSRLLPSIAGTGLRLATAAYLALLLAYGVGDIANDFWLEQVGKRGWTTWLVPSVLEPHIGWGWAVVIVEACVIWTAWFSREAP